MARARSFNNARCLIQLRACWQKRGAIFQRPAVILHMRHFNPRGTPGKRQINHRRQIMQILPMHHGVECQRQARFTHQPCRYLLARMRTLHAADALCALSLGILDGKLHVIEARSLQPRE